MSSLSSVLSRRGVAAAASVMASALALTLTACSPSQPAEPELESGDYQAAAMQWRDDVDSCMLAAGFDLTPTDGNDSIDMSQFDMVAFDAAYASCVEEVGPPPVDESLPSEDEIFEAQLLFAECMRAAGYDYPDPVKGDGGISPAFGPETDPDDVDACSAQAYENAGSR